MAGATAPAGFFGASSFGGLRPPPDRAQEGQLETRPRLSFGRVSSFSRLGSVWGQFLPSEPQCSVMIFR
jgi:hypothetical protein